MKIYAKASYNSYNFSWPIEETQLNADAVKKFGMNQPVHISSTWFDADNSHITYRDFLTGNYGEGDCVRIVVEIEHTGELKSISLDYCWDDDNETWELSSI